MTTTPPADAPAFAHGPAMTIDARFLDSHQRSAALHAGASALLPGGITHDIRHFEPFPIYVERAAGPRKWDVDGNEIIDFVMGHGALLYGHAHPLLVDAVSRQIRRGTHYGASHEREVEWASLIVELLPSAEKVRFMASGTEATMLAARLARTATGRSKLLKLRDHFHGWNDSWGIELVTQPGGDVVGLPPAMSDAVQVLDQHDAAGIAAALAGRDIAAVICEPGGAHWGALPLHPEMLARLRELTSATGTLLIFDEVVTGFRASEHGYQGLTGVTPDLTTLAKIVAGGLPGGAVAGRADLLDQIVAPLAAPPAGEPATTPVRHPGTFNANPLTAAAGVAALRGLRDGGPIRAANAAGERLCRGWNAAIRSAEVARRRLLPGLDGARRVGPRSAAARGRAGLELRRGGASGDHPQHPGGGPVAVPPQPPAARRRSDRDGRADVGRPQRDRHRHGDRRVRRRPGRPAPGVDPLATTRPAAPSVAPPLDTRGQRMRK